MTQKKPVSGRQPSSLKLSTELLERSAVGQQKNNNSDHGSCFGFVLDGKLGQYHSSFDCENGFNSDRTF